MKKLSESRVVVGNVDDVLVRYNDEADAFGSDSIQLGLLRERYLGDHLELAADLYSYFQNEDAVQGRLDCVYDPPSQFERYTDVTRLGEGGQAIVYKAFDQELKTWVALKFSKSAALATAAEAQRFRFEAQSMAQLTHPNVARIFDVKDYKGRPFLCMEFFPGGSLETHLDRFIQDSRSGARLMVSVSRAVHHAHQRRILHRDLKPSNILLDTDDKFDRPCVSDFGLAKPMDAESLQRDWQAEPEPDMTAYGRIVGTASYMSPEQASGKDVTTLSDVYGLGTILYALQTGQRLYQEETVEETLRRVSDPESKPRSPRELNPGLDRTFEAICLKCLEKKRRNRYRSAEGLAKDLDRWMVHLPTEARPPKPAERLSLWCRRNPVGVGLVAVLIVLVTLVGLNVLDRLEEPRRLQEDLAETQAAVLEVELDDQSEEVLAVATNPVLIGFLTDGDLASLQAFVEETGDQSEEMRGESPFESLFVLDLQGNMLARWPDLPSETADRNSGYRDYFQGTLTLEAGGGRRTYISEVYRAFTDELYKYAIGALVRNGDKELGMVVASVTTGPERDWPEPEGVTTALLVPKDQSSEPDEPDPPEGASEFLILVHPAYEPGGPPVWFPEEQIAMIQNDCVDDYSGPVIALDNPAAAEYVGRWTACFATVEGSRFVVVVQQRYVPLLPVELWIVVGLALAAVFLTLTIVYLLPRSTKPVRG